MKFVKELFQAGYTVKELLQVVERMASDAYWKEHPFDMVNVYNNIHKYTKATPEPKWLPEQKMLLELEKPEQRQAIDAAKEKMKGILRP